MATFGENLRREREMRGVTLEEIAESTKISTRLLRALEQEQFSELPGGVFTRSFIRAYAGYLGLDSELVLAEYRQVAQPNSDYDLNRLTAATSLTSKATSRVSALPWVVAAILLGGGYATYRYAHRPLDTSFPSAVAPAASVTPSSPGPATAPSAPAQDSATKPAASEIASPQGSESATQSANPNAEPARTPAAGNPSVPADSGTASDNTGGTVTAAPAADQQTTPEPRTTPSESAGANTPAAAPVLGDGDLVLRVATTEDAWLAVAADGKTLMQRTLPPNSVRIFRAKDAFDVTTGNAAGTSLALNGEPQKALGRHGEFRRIHLTRDGLPSPTKPETVPN
jgi:cytoskeleton protein RodZ